MTASCTAGALCSRYSAVPAPSQILANDDQRAEGRIAGVTDEGVSCQDDPEGMRVAISSGGAEMAEYLHDSAGDLTTTLDLDASGKLARGAFYGAGVHLAHYTAGAGAGRTEFQWADQVGLLFVKIDQAVHRGQVSEQVFSALDAKEQEMNVKSARNYIIAILVMGVILLYGLCDSKGY